MKTTYNNTDTKKMKKTVTTKNNNNKNKTSPPSTTTKQHMKTTEMSPSRADPTADQCAVDLMVPLSSSRYRAN